MSDEIKKLPYEPANIIHKLADILSVMYNSISFSVSYDKKEYQVRFVILLLGSSDCIDMSKIKMLYDLCAENELSLAINPYCSDEGGTGIKVEIFSCVNSLTGTEINKNIHFVE